ncbi:unnamed protein product [Psylliodes chrysocephalus]|uniref:Uncharacterized protein n=1 Tax=Psylliodes chrysocephalus TaxID=3402493 RepID=A0A9P0CPP5_9CUCU|nr:unnamed protein product [Psylliodes chrysocephala]
MAQAFVTTIQNCYRYTPQAAFPLIRQERYYPDCYGKDWYNSKDQKHDEDFHKIEIAVKNQHIRRVSTSTYKFDYCRDWTPPIIIEENSDKPKELGEFHLIDTFRPVYQKNRDQIKLIQPLQSSRNIFGYLPKSDIYIPMSSFQDCYGKLGFELLEKAHFLQKKSLAKEKEVA